MTRLLPHDLPGLHGGQYRPLAPADVDRIADAAFTLLERGGVAVYSQQAREAFAAAGAEVDEASCTVRLPRALVEDAIESNPSSITLHGRDGGVDCVLEENRVHYGTGGTAIYVLDPDTGQRRPSETRDVILNARMVEALRHIHLFTINVYPNDISDAATVDVNRFFHAFDHTRKHVMGGIYSLEGCQNVVKMAQEIAGGAEALRAAPFLSFITLIISPLKIDGKYGDMTCYCAREGLPVVVPTEPICGTTSPVTLAANVLLHTAETLAGIAMVQCINKGAPGICGSVGSITNNQTMDHVGGAIERGMLNAAVAQMAQHFKLPLYSTGGTTDAKSVEVQAAYESAMSSLLVAMSGANYIHDIAGLMETDLTVAYDKLVLDNEILGMCQRVLRGIEVDDKTLALDLMIDKGPNVDYLGERHTRRYMRKEFYQPELASRDKREQMGPDGTAGERARAAVARMRVAPAESLLDPAVRSRLIETFPEIKQAASA
ncbi:MAG: trimethylamine methyltransferase family protein [Planctomycetota bacterium]